jgi:pyruvate/2-oxoglutarate dehydrogenase complex dihydrolipoamide dehydrogenase (E3) component
MVELLTPDLCVIGAGSAGLSVAVGAARFGVPVVLVERGRMGGDCLNYGCVPSKALLAAAKRANALGELGRYGLKVQRPKVDFLDVHAHVEGVIRTIAPTDSKERMTGLGIRMVSGSARFIDMRTLMVGDGIEIRPRRTIIATGSEPAIPPIPGLSETPYLTNRTIFELTKCPRHLIVIGGGPIGIELAQAHRRLGAEVTVLEAATPLPKDDPECAAVVLDQLARDGVAVRANIKVVRVERAHPRIRAVFLCDGREETIEGSHLLVATGRRPNFEGLGLDTAGIAHSREGIAVDKRLRTSNRRVYAIGDAIAGGPKFTHAANLHAGLVIRNALFRLPIDVSKEVVPWVTYTDPELALAGLREEEARRRYRAIRILRWP